jgi:hypothetical protein
MVEISTESRKVKGMAHNFRIKVVPHKNKDGTESATKKDYEVWDRPRRGGRRLVGVESSMKRATDLIAAERLLLVTEHLSQHPNDLAFVTKHHLIGD